LPDFTACRILAAKPMTKISVIICSYNRENYIIQAIDSLYHQTIARSEYEVIVVDNNSTDNTEQVCTAYIAAHPDYNIRYMTETQQGASFARNTGAAVANSPLFAFMDDDAIAEKNYLERVLQFFDNHPDACGMGGRIIPIYVPAEPKWMSHFVSSLVGHFHYSDAIEVFRNGRFPLESNMIVRREDFESIGAFNVLIPGVVGKLRIGGEAKEFFYRLMALGKKVYYDPLAIVHHVVEVKKLTPEYMHRVASGIGRGEKVRTLQQSQWAYVKKIAEYFYKLAGSVVLALFYALQGTPAKSWPVIKFRIDAIKGLLS
jgi:glucosyl-dolichyl phosphate glucuronosyltransferase